MESYFQINWWRGDGESPGNHSSSPAGRPEASLLSWGPALALLHAQRPQGSHLHASHFFTDRWNTTGLSRGKNELAGAK